MSGSNAFPVSRARPIGVAIGLAGALCASVFLATSVSPAAQAQTANAANPTSAEHAKLLAEQAWPHKVVPFNPADFDKYVGYYEFTPTMFIHVFRHGDHYFAELTGQPAVQWYPQSPTEFFATVVAAQISFASDAGGVVTQLVLHQDGRRLPAKRVAARVALAAAADLAMRIKKNIPSPGVAAALRSQLESFERTGHARYAQMSAQLAAAAHQRAAKMATLFKSLGALKSLRFYRVLPNGADVYVAVFAHGTLQIFISALTSDGKIPGMFFQRLP